MGRSSACPAITLLSPWACTSMRRAFAFSERRPREPLLILRLLTALAVFTVGGVGWAAWGSLSMQPMLLLFGVVVLGHAYLAGRLVQRTSVGAAAIRADGLHA